MMARFMRALWPNNMTNIGLNIHSDMLCEISSQNLNVSQVET